MLKKLTKEELEQLRNNLVLAYIKQKSAYQEKQLRLVNKELKKRG